jgi:hypothetical protein
MIRTGFYVAVSSGKNFGSSKSGWGGRRLELADVFYGGRDHEYSNVVASWICWENEKTRLTPVVTQRCSDEHFIVVKDDLHFPTGGLLRSDKPLLFMVLRISSEISDHEDCFKVVYTHLDGLARRVFNRKEMETLLVWEKILGKPLDDIAIGVSYDDFDTFHRDSLCLNTRRER